jgi:predicted signal transduction protein with EAL and GGDEF domain
VSLFSDQIRAVGRAVLLVLVAALVLASSLLGLLAPFDQGLRDLRFAATGRAPSGEIVFVEIDAASLADVGVWPWPRTVHAELLDNLMALGADEVVFDIDFSAASTVDADAAFEAALRRAGGYAWLAAFQQRAMDGTLVLNQPLPRLAAEASPVLVNVDGDGTGLLQSVPAALGEPPIPSVARALVPDATAGPSIFIDFGIDLAAVPRVAATSVLDRTIDPSAIAGRKVVVGASAVELRDFFRVPRFGVIPGPMVQIAATETLMADRALVEVGSRPVMAVSALAAILLILFGRRVAVPRLFVGTLVIGTLVEVAAWLALRDGRLLFDTAGLHVLGGALVILALIEEWLQRRAESRRQQARLAWLARHDSATGALSRQALIDDLDGSASDGPLVLVELGRLDIVTATLGHDIADRVTIEVIARLKRLTDGLPARIGTNLLAMIPKVAATPAQLAAAVTSLLDAPYTVEGHAIHLQARLGLSAYDPAPAAERLRQADVALGLAQRDLAAFASYSPEHGRSIEERRQLDLALRCALKEHQFFLVFQPQVNLATGEMIGVEALVRWQHPELGLVSPAAFVPLAEETGLITELGDWVLHEACRQAASWDWAGRLSVNVSGAQFMFSDVVATARDALAASGFPAHRLDIEITESLFINNRTDTSRALAELRQLGAHIALDDFGTGYSSLSYLSQLPIDKIKIDQSFVQALPASESRAIIDTVALMAHRLGKTLIAEGIETEAQHSYLVGIGCPVGQGYLFGRPSDPKAIGLFSSKPVAA